MDCSIDNIRLTTKNKPQNLIQALGFHVGSIAGYIESSTISHCTVTNTTVRTAGSIVGGLVASIYRSTITNLNNNGFPSNPLQIIVEGVSYIGGVVGEIGTSTITKSGVSRGTVKSIEGSYIGGVVGTVYLTDVDQVYSRPGVSVFGTESSFNCGGLFGYYNTFKNDANHFLRNSYSRANNVVCGMGKVGGLSGFLEIFSLFSNLNLTNCYASTFVSGSSSVGSLFGSMNKIPNITNVFYDNVKAGNSTIGIGLNCSNLFENIVSFFPQNTIWGNDRLIIESDYSPGILDCQDFTFAPTIAPIPTTSPTTSPTSSKASLITASLFLILTFLLFV
eukprot:TRINITY_DN5135_c0_g1_i1.p1 TRINITY_DN5135_c0_g1~~TRINITY_DN5135_c0_g1_i1.p1  ORF type:complete len:334 (+),score=52.19 TRINITY_DN5135_c0_g1_i1:231-1232(+)